ncbi:ACT domain-containing protein [Alkalicoccus chagannorensis]|uniref:ACT domain-containing protein n=1 Tax=Alkalicoccus chagannorensis TaxID=427072 RepID=UPI00040F2EFF|nr:ACT domain-containing protein [Alkalicoccus chagannorensis]
MSRTRAVVSVVGQDQVGIIAAVTTALADKQVNILDISQTILQDFFTMMMLVEIPEHMERRELEERMDQVSSSMQLKIDIQREELFQSMHRI